MAVSKIMQARDGIAAFRFRTLFRDGRIAGESVLTFSSNQIRQLYDGARLLEKWENRVDAPSPVRAVARAIDGIVDRCRDADGKKVAAAGSVHIIAEESEALKRACDFLTEYEANSNAAADRRSRKREQQK